MPRGERLSARALRRQCSRRLRDLGLLHAIEFDDLVQWVGAVSRRPIRLLALDFPADRVCGVWVQTEWAHYVGYRADTTPLHRRHIVLHEFGHVLCAHRTGSVLEAAMLGGLVPLLDPRTVERVLGRVEYSTREEREAETIATLLQAHLLIRPTPGWTAGWQQPGPPETAERIQLIERSLLGGGRG